MAEITSMQNIPASTGAYLTGSIQNDRVKNAGENEINNTSSVNSLPIEFQGSRPTCMINAFHALINWHLKKSGKAPLDIDKLYDETIDNPVNKFSFISAAVKKDFKQLNGFLGVAIHFGASKTIAAAEG